MENNKLENLDKFAVNLNERAAQGKLDPVIGRDDEIRRVLQILSRRTKNNPILVGEPGVGKTAISEGIAQASQTTSPGLYLMLRKKRRSQEANFSLDIHYLMTNGDAVNSVLDAKSQLSASAASYIREVRIKADPMPGHGEIQGADAEEVLARYYMVTNDRIVTPMDIKVFCYKELVTRFGITPDMISSVKVKNVRHTDSVRPAFETRVYIILKDSPYVKRGFGERIPMVEWVFQKMIEVRSTNLFPVHVNIEIV